jgi:hypothetical protein
MRSWLGFVHDLPVLYQFLGNLVVLHHDHVERGGNTHLAACAMARALCEAAWMHGFGGGFCELEYSRSVVQVDAVFKVSWLTWASCCCTWTCLGVSWQCRRVLRAWLCGLDDSCGNTKSALTSFTSGVVRMHASMLTSAKACNKHDALVTDDFV